MYGGEVVEDLAAIPAQNDLGAPHDGAPKICLCDELAPCGSFSDVSALYGFESITIAALPEMKEVLTAGVTATANSP